MVIEICTVNFGARHLPKAPCRENIQELFPCQAEMQFIIIIPEQIDVEPEKTTYITRF